MLQAGYLYISGWKNISPTWNLNFAILDGDVTNLTLRRTKFEVNFV